ncbi:hypothetical protein [Paracoccus sanguinis]|nr:hypothetical protein [Paracoccus sanguinis]
MSKRMWLTLAILWSLSIWSVLVLREVHRIDLQATIITTQP